MLGVLVQHPRRSSHCYVYGGNLSLTDQWPKTTYTSLKTTYQPGLCYLLKRGSKMKSGEIKQEPRKMVSL